MCDTIRAAIYASHYRSDKLARKKSYSCEMISICVSVIYKFPYCGVLVLVIIPNYQTDLLGLERIVVTRKDLVSCLCIQD